MEISRPKLVRVRGANVEKEALRNDYDDHDKEQLVADETDPDKSRSIKKDVESEPDTKISPLREEILRKCCLCFDLKTGTMIVGVLNMVIRFGAEFNQQY